MKYTVPQLVLIGDAKALVLTNVGISDSHPACDIIDNPGNLESDLPELW